MGIVVRLHRTHLLPLQYPAGERVSTVIEELNVLNEDLFVGQSVAVLSKHCVCFCIWLCKHAYMFKCEHNEKVNFRDRNKSITYARFILGL